MISTDVCILTKAELKAREDAAFARGVRRGRFEERHDIAIGKSPPVEKEPKS